LLWGGGGMVKKKKGKKERKPQEDTGKGNIWRKHENYLMRSSWTRLGMEYEVEEASLLPHMADEPTRGE
jgi:hypothetical protein